MDSAELTDEQLAEQMRNGCRDSAAELYRRYRPRLLHVLQKRLPQRVDAEDVAQQTMIRLLERIDTYNPRRRFGPWLFTIALRLATDSARRKKHVSHDQDEQPPAVDSSPPPEQEAMDREERQQLWQLADRVLKPDQWTALWLFYGEQQSVREVAQAMGKASVTVRVLLYRARKTLMPHLSPNRDEGEDVLLPGEDGSTQPILEGTMQ